MNDDRPSIQRRSSASGAQAGPARVVLIALSALVLSSILAACGESASVGEPQALGKPPGFDELEPAVRAQYEERSEALETLLASRAAPAAARGAAWGALGQWFHIYRFQDSAIRCYREAVRLDGDDPRWHYFLGLLAIEEGLLDEAETALAEASRRAPDSSMAPVRLAELMLERRDDARAEHYFQQALERSPDDRAARLGLARLALQRGDAPAAIELAEPLVEDGVAPDLAVHYLLGQAYRVAGDAAAAESHMRRVAGAEHQAVVEVRDDPWMRELTALNISSNNLSSRGRVAYLRGNYAAAARFAAEAVRYNPDDAELRANYGAALLALERPVDALVQLDRALELDSGLGRAYVIKGGAHHQLGQIGLARAALLRAIEIDPGLDEARRKLGRMEYQRGRLGAAVEQYAWLRSTGEEARDARFWHAATLAAMGRYADALGALDEDLLALPDDAWLRLLQVRILAVAPVAAGGDPERAAERFGQIVLDPPNVFYAETAAMLAAARDERERAIAWQQRAADALGESSHPSADLARRRLVLYREGGRSAVPWARSERLNLRPVQPADRPENLD